MHVTLVKSDPRAREKPCLRCGYSLRKLLDSKHCPECGLSIWLSLNSNDSLDWSRPSWLRRLSIAVWIMAFSQILGLAGYIMLWREHPPAPIVSEDGSGQRVVTPPSPVRHSPLTRVYAGSYLLIYNAALLLMAGYEGRHPDKWHSYRLGCRIAAGVGMVVGVFLLTSPNELLFRLSLLGSAVATFAYLRKLAQRIPLGILVRICGFVLLAPALTFLKSLPIFYVYFAAFQLLGLVEYLPWLYLPVTAVLLGWFAILFRKASISAEAGWAKESGSPTVLEAA